MSVLFATITPDTIILCADKLATHSKTGEAQTELVNKIEQWSPTIAIGGTGIKTLRDIIISGVHGFIEENGIYYFDRSPKFDVGRLCAIQQRTAAYEKN